MRSAPNQELPPLVVIGGPTASGKTALALALAEHLPIEVISADSRQVYRLMDIGTAKPSPAERQQVPHHLLDVVWPDEPFDAAQFARQADPVIAGIIARGRLPVLVGGTGLYIRALTAGLAEVPPADPAVRRRWEEFAAAQGEGALHRRLTEVDPVTAARLHANDLVRLVRALEVFELTGTPLSTWHAGHGFRQPSYRLLKLAPQVEREELYRRIDERAVAMFAGGLVEETSALLAAGYSGDLKSLQTIGYREALRLLAGACTGAEALAELQQATRRYAKRQMTWFRAEPGLIWVDSGQSCANIMELIESFQSQ